MIPSGAFDLNLKKVSLTFSSSVPVVWKLDENYLWSPSPLKSLLDILPFKF